MENKICPKCGNEVPESAKFCSACGTPQIMEAPAPEKVNPPEVQEKDSTPENDSVPEPEKKAPTSENDSVPEPEKKAPTPENDSIPKPEKKAPTPHSSYMDYSYDPQGYTVENGNSQGAGALIVFIVVMAMIVVSLVVCMIMSAAAFVNKTRKQTEKDFSVSSDKSYSYSDYDDYDDYDDDDYYNDYDSDDYYNYDDVYDSDDLVDEGPVWTEDQQKPIDGFFKSGDYKVGQDIPAGTYLLKANIYRFDNEEYADGYRSVSAGISADDDLVNDWFEYTCYVELKEGNIFHISHCAAYDISKCQIENDPFEHPGTFMVGKDVEPGTYKLSLIDSHNPPMYAVYDKIESIGVPFWVSDPSSSALYIGDVYGDEEITLEEGQFLVLSSAILVRETETTKDRPDRADKSEKNQ